MSTLPTVTLETITGQLSGISNSDYHALPHVSSSGLTRLITQTPAHFQAYLTERPDPTPAMLFGTAVHTAVLEPLLFDMTYVKKPEGMNFATKEGKAWRDAQAGREILTSEQFEKIDGVRNAVSAHPLAKKLLTGGKAEESFFWRDAKTGILCRCRPDYLVGDTVIDIKTSENASEHKFQRSIMDFGYHIQTAFYLRGISQVTGKKLTDFVHIVVEKSAPYAVACYVLDDASIEKANELIDAGLARYKECLETGIWPAYPTELIAINLPHWGF